MSGSPSQHGQLHEVLKHSLARGRDEWRRYRSPFEQLDNQRDDRRDMWLLPDIRLSSFARTKVSDLLKFMIIYDHRGHRGVHSELCVLGRLELRQGLKRTAHSVGSQLIFFSLKWLVMRLQAVITMFCYDQSSSARRDLNLHLLLAGRECSTPPALSDRTRHSHLMLHLLLGLLVLRNANRSHSLLISIL